MVFFLLFFFTCLFHTSTSALDGENDQGSSKNILDLANKRNKEKVNHTMRNLISEGTSRNIQGGSYQGKVSKAPKSFKKLANGELFHSEEDEEHTFTRDMKKTINRVIQHIRNGKEMSAIKEDVKENCRVYNLEGDLKDGFRITGPFEQSYTATIKEDEGKKTVEVVKHSNIPEEIAKFNSLDDNHRGHSHRHSHHRSHRHRRSHSESPHHRKGESSPRIVRQLSESPRNLHLLAIPSHNKPSAHDHHSESSGRRHHRSKSSLASSHRHSTADSGDHRSSSPPKSTSSLQPFAKDNSSTKYLTKSSSTRFATDTVNSDRTVESPVSKGKKKTSKENHTPLSSLAPSKPVRFAGVEPPQYSCASNNVPVKTKRK